ncbi:MAG: hypothetical protein ACU85V_10345 [Gammaproteobacteria bacterium]
MGEEISTTEFAPADFTAFAGRLAAETAALGECLRAGDVSEAGFTWGFEVEAWLLDHASFPNPVNERLLAALDDADVVPELSRFNVELNTAVRGFTADTFSEAERDLTALWRRCNDVAHALDTNLVTIGTLPTVREADLSLGNISPLKRYYALNHELLAANRGRPLEIDIAGTERLNTRHTDVMLEAGATSFQVHFKTPAAVAHEYYNASLALSAPVLAACVNSPILFGRLLWDETRIPLFEQSIAGVSGAAAINPRVCFGERYLEHSILEAFEENLSSYPVLLPILFDEPATAFRHLSLHNGTIWRWNRPLVGASGDGLHVRLEHRALPAGPTLVDMLANAALYLGAVHERVLAGRDDGVDAAHARHNFYQAARHGLDAELQVGDRALDARAWLLETLIGDADSGLARLGVGSDDRRRLLGIIEARVDSGQTGAAWQRAAYTAAGRNAFELVAQYCELQRSGAPVHEWPRP